MSELTGKASSWPLKTQMPEMLLLLSVPNKMTLAKAFFLSLSRRWNIPVAKQTNLINNEWHFQDTNVSSERQKDIWMVRSGSNCFQLCKKKKKKKLTFRTSSTVTIAWTSLLLTKQRWLGWIWLKVLFPHQIKTECHDRTPPCPKTRERQQRSQ